MTAKTILVHFCMCDIKSVLYYDSKLCIFHSHGGLTCHYCAYQKKDTQEDVSCQRAVIVNDLALANGEYNSEHLCVGAEHGVVRIKASACTHPGRIKSKPRPWTRFLFSCILDLLQLANMFMHQMKEAQLHTEFLQIYHAQLPWCWENLSCLLMNRHYKCINKTMK